MARGETQRHMSKAMKAMIAPYIWGILKVSILPSCKNKLGSPQPLGKYLSFLEASIAFEGMGRPRGFRRFRKTHLENILPRGSRDRDPRYPKGVPWDQNFFLKNFLSKSYLGICRQVWGLLWVKSDFEANNCHFKGFCSYSHKYPFLGQKSLFTHNNP